MPWFYTGAYETTCETINGCIGADIFNFWQKYFYDFVGSLKYFVYDVSMSDELVIQGIIIVFALFLLLWFIVGIFFIFKHY